MILGGWVRNMFVVDGWARKEEKEMNSVKNIFFWPFDQSTLSPSVMRLT